MANNRPITVGLIGISDIEEKRLQAAFKYSEHRPTSYLYQSLDMLPGIVIVNADDPDSLIGWRIYQDGLSNHGIDNPPSMMVSLENQQSNNDNYYTRRPLIISRVISILDKIVHEKIESDSEVAISSDVNIGIVETIVLNDDREQISNLDLAKHMPSALVVDDSLPVRIQMETALKKFTSRIDLAETGEEAINMVNNNDYDVVFLDIILPGKDGYEICKIIKEGKCKNTPVILLTGNSSPADRIKGNLSGCDTYLIKPMNQTVFESIVSRYLNTSSPRNRLN